MIFSMLNVLYSAGWFAQCWKICNTWNDLYNVKWFELGLMIYTTCTALNILYYVEWFSKRWKFLLCWKICAALNDLQWVGIILSAMDDLYKIESFGLR